MSSRVAAEARHWVFFREHRVRALRRLVRLGVPQDAAEDIYHSALLSMLNASAEGRYGLGTRLQLYYGLADWHRAQVREEALRKQIGESNAVLQRESPIADGDVREAVALCRNTDPEGMFVLWEHCVEGETLAHIGRKLSVSLSTIRHLKSRAAECLREILGDRERASQHRSERPRGAIGGTNE